MLENFVGLNFDEIKLDILNKVPYWISGGVFKQNQAGIQCFFLTSASIKRRI